MSITTRDTIIRIPCMGNSSPILYHPPYFFSPPHSYKTAQPSIPSPLATLALHTLLTEQYRPSTVSLLSHLHYQPLPPYCQHTALGWHILPFSPAVYSHLSQLTLSPEMFWEELRRDPHPCHGPSGCWPRGCPSRLALITGPPGVRDTARETRFSQLTDKLQADNVHTGS